MATATVPPLPRPPSKPRKARITRLPRRRWPTPWQWVVFALQVMLVAMVEIGDDIVRGIIIRPNTQEALCNARDVAAFEASHGFFVEPAVQHFFEHPHDMFGFVLTWGAVT